MLFNLCGALQRQEPPTEPHSIDTSYFRSCTNDGTYGVDVTTIITEAMPGETITIATGLSEWDSWELQTDFGNVVTKTLIDTYMYTEFPMPATPFYVYTFTMPDGDVVAVFV